jgi:hypothetical protein
VRGARPERSAWALNQSENRFAEFLAAFGTGHGLEELLPAEALHLAEGLLDRAPIGNGLLEPFNTAPWTRRHKQSCP